MRTKRTIGYSILILIIGIFLGWAIFGSSNHNGHAHEEGVNEAQIWTCSMDPQVRTKRTRKMPPLWNGFNSIGKYGYRRKSQYGCYGQGRC